MRIFRDTIAFILLTVVFISFSAASEEPESGVSEKQESVEITTVMLPSCYSGDEYSTHISVSGGSGHYRYHSESLVSGLKLKDDGLITGKVKADPGDYSIIITATDTIDTNLHSRKILNMKVLEPLSIKKTDSAPVISGVDYKQQITVSGGEPPVSFKVEGLPSGLQADPEGFIQGIADAEPGTYAITISVSDSFKPEISISKTIEFEVYDPVSVTSDQLSHARKKHRFKTALTAEGGSGNYTFHADSLPQGLSLSSSGKLSGKPEVARGDYPFVVTVTDKKLKISAEKKLVLTVVDFFPDDYESLKDNDFQSLNSVSAGDSRQDHTFDIPGDRDVIRLDFTGVVAGDVIQIYTKPWTTGTETLLELYSENREPVSGVIRSKEETYSELVFVCNHPGIYYAAVNEPGGETGDYRFSVENKGQKVALVTRSFSDVLSSRPVSLSVKAEKGSGEYGFSADGLPEGLSITEDGTIQSEGTVRAGNYNFKVTVKDIEWSGITETQPYTLTVVDYFPDSFEVNGDNTLDTSVDIKPGSSPQHHTFNYSGDIDFVKLDLSGSLKGDIIDISTLPLTGNTKTGITLYDQDKKVIATDTGSGVDGHSRLFYECAAPGIYYIEVREVSSDTGDYQLKVTNTGPKLAFETLTIPDIINKGKCDFQCVAVKGSGNYRFESEGFPGSLLITPEGMITGNTGVNAGEHPVSISVHDVAYPGVFTRKSFVIKVVDFYPDAYEAKGDNDFNTNVTMIPGDESQDHTFNYPGDTDFIRLDLSSVDTGDVIHVVTSMWTRHSPTSVALYDSQKKLVTSAAGSQESAYGSLFYVLRKQGPYYLKLDQPDGKTGDYRVFIYDKGRAAQFVTDVIPDVITKKEVSFQFSASDGSGSYRFKTGTLPDGLTLSDSGLLQGVVNVSSGSYPLSLTLYDTTYTGIQTEKSYTLTVVDFYPDQYELPGDNDFNTASVLVPGGSQQDHTFNYEGDVDYIRLDLTAVTAGNVLDIATTGLTKPTGTRLTLYNSEKKPVLAEQEKPDKTNRYSRLFFECSNPGEYYLKTEEINNNTGDYRLSVTDTGPVVRIITSGIPDVLTHSTIDTTIEAIDGSGNYKFMAENLPAGLSMNSDGRITGGLKVVAGVYPFTVRVSDMDYSGISHEVSLAYTVVDYFPDTYETAGDNDNETLNVMKPGETAQEHTFNYKGDEDFIKLDLTGCSSGDVIKIVTEKLTGKTATKLSLFRLSEQVAKGYTTKNSSYGRLVFHCEEPGIYLLKSEETHKLTGDYKIMAINTGRKLRIEASSIRDALKHASYSTQIKVVGGCGKHTITGKGIPGGLGVDVSGKVTGTVKAESNRVHTFTITAKDAEHPENFVVKSMSVKVVDYYPDSFEVAGDNDFNTTAVMTSGTSHDHNFNTPGDNDYIRLVFDTADPGDVIIIESKKLDRLTDTMIRLYDGSQKELLSDDNSGKGGYSKLVFHCKDPGIYYLKVSHAEKKTGDYRVSVNNSGQPLKIRSETMPVAESDDLFSSHVETTGGCGKYRYALSKGKLPGGLKLNPATGMISGKNTAWGPFRFTVSVFDNAFPENNTSREFDIEAYMGKKLTGTDRVVYPHLVSGTYSSEIDYNQTVALPGTLSGGTPGNLRYRIIRHTIPKQRFSYTFDPGSGSLKLKELAPVACNQYSNTEIEVEVEVRDRLYTNNTMIFRYQIPAKCLTY